MNAAVKQPENPLNSALLSLLLQGWRVKFSRPPSEGHCFPPMIPSECRLLFTKTNQHFTSSNNVFHMLSTSKFVSVRWYKLLHCPRTTLLTGSYGHPIIYPCPNHYRTARSFRCHIQGLQQVPRAWFIT